jgi:hypothetical protein
MADYELEINFDHHDFEEDLEKGKEFIESMKKIVRE